MRIAIDAMGGDNAPHEIVKGTILAADEHQAEFILLGDEALVRQHLPKRRPNIHLHHTTQVVEMADSPVKAIARKQDSSLVVGAQMVKDRTADALVTVGNTGAAVAVTKILWQMIPGIERPAIATVLPHMLGHSVLVDSGATTDCEPEWLFQFALMGAAFSRQVMGVAEPRLALLNIGEEPGKGNQLAKRTHELFAARLPGFVGNLEGKDIFTEQVDVIICDGFAGNVVLKTCEGVVSFLFKLAKEELPKSKLLLSPLLLYTGTRKRIEKRVDYAEYGGAPLLGVDGICIIGHGRSNAKAVKGAISEAVKAVQGNLVNAIAETVRSASPEPSGV